MLRLSRSARGLLLLLFLCAVVTAQVGSLANETHQHSSTQHCCGLCHIGPLPFLQPAISASVSPQLTVLWIAGFLESESPHEVLLSDGSSRAPPAASGLSL